MARKKNKKEATKGDKLHQAWRNRQAMFRVYEAATASRSGVNPYWVPFDIRTLNM